MVMPNREDQFRFRSFNPIENDSAPIMAVRKEEEQAEYAKLEHKTALHAAVYIEDRDELKMVLDMLGLKTKDES